MTIKEVAELAGVSNAAVSRYLNGGYLAADKRERIREAIARTGYAPSAQARALRTGSTRIVGVIVPKINSESISRVTAGIGRVLRERGYQMLLADTGNHAERELEFLELFQGHPVDGIILVATILTPQHRAFLKGSRVPVVVVGQRARGFNCVFHDDAGAARDLGRRVARICGAGARVGYLGVTREDRAAGRARMDGFTAGLEAGGVAFDPALYREGPFSIQAGYEGACELLGPMGPEGSDGSDPGAPRCGIDFISCATDTIAAGAIQAVIERFGSLRAPGAPGISGFGDNQFLRAVSGGILTVHFGYMTSGIKATQMLLGIIDGETTVGMQLELGYELIVPRTPPAVG